MEESLTFKLCVSPEDASDFERYIHYLFKRNLVIHLSLSLFVLLACLYPVFRSENLNLIIGVMLLWALAWIWLWPKKPNALIIPKAATSQCVSVDMCLNQAFLELGYGAEKEEYPWSLFKAWLRTKTHFFVFVAPNYAMIIPFNQISLQSQTALLAFLNQRVGKPRSALLGYRR